MLRSLWYPSAQNVLFWSYRVKESPKNIASYYLQEENERSNPLFYYESSYSTKSDTGTLKIHLTHVFIPVKSLLFQDSCRDLSSNLHYPRTNKNLY